MERNTAQRRAIHKALEDAGRPMGPNEIFEAARGEVPGLGIATVYRAIKQLLDDGFLAQVELAGVAGKRAGHFRAVDGEIGVVSRDAAQRRRARPRALAGRAVAVACENARAD
ncbi:MAG: transcriptional repressor [Planctomycetaceae bacterium]|nr:transcriptional repressor [Planctomycetaceae bacterium]